MHPSTARLHELSYIQSLYVAEPPWIGLEKSEKKIIVVPGNDIEILANVSRVAPSPCIRQDLQQGSTEVQPLPSLG
jgi:hypothetical protein